MEGELLMTVLPYKGVSIFNEDGTFRKEDDVVQGRSYSSNLTKMLKQWISWKQSNRVNHLLL